MQVKRKNMSNRTRNATGFVPEGRVGTNICYKRQASCRQAIECMSFLESRRCEKKRKITARGFVRGLKLLTLTPSLSVKIHKLKLCTRLRFVLVPSFRISNVLVITFLTSPGLPSRQASQKMGERAQTSGRHLWYSSDTGMPKQARRRRNV